MCASTTAVTALSSTTIESSTMRSEAVQTDDLTAIPHGNFDLALEPDQSRVHFDFEGPLVDALEKAGAQA